MIRLCPKSDVFMVEEKDDSLPVLEVSEKVNDIECTVCETVIGVVRAAIDFNSTEVHTHRHTGIHASIHDYLHVHA